MSADSRSCCGCTWLSGFLSSKDKQAAANGGAVAAAEVKADEKKVAKNGPLKIIIAGAPASGKGTQCDFIKAKYGVVHISTGDVLRAAVAAGTELGHEAKKYMDAGQLVPDEVMIGLVKSKLQEPDCLAKGWLLDGFPRTEAQAQALTEAGIIANILIIIDVPDQILEERVVGRRLDPQTGKIYHIKFNRPENEEIEARLTQRSDDTVEKVRVRLEAYHKHIDAIVSQYKGSIVRVDGNRGKEEVFEHVKKAIDSGSQ